MSVLQHFVSEQDSQYRGSELTLSVLRLMPVVFRLLHGMVCKTLEIFLQLRQMLCLLTLFQHTVMQKEKCS